MKTDIIHQISAYNISSIRSNKLLFENINFTIQSGNILEIYGSNGTGKTTLLKIMSGMLQPSKGIIKVNNDNVVFNRYLHQVSYLDSSPNYRESFTTLNYLLYWVTLYSNILNISYEYIGNITYKLGIHHLHNTEISKLSLGQRKRLLLCKLLLLNKHVWILDEPYIGLDSYWISQLNIILDEHAYKGGIIILSTHSNINTNRRYTISLDDLTP